MTAAFRQGSRLRAAPTELRRRDHLILRDVQQVARLNRTSDMRKLISLLADQTCGLLSMSRLAGALAVTVPTVRSWIQILETIYLIRLVPASSPSS